MRVQDGFEQNNWRVGAINQPLNGPFVTKTIFRKSGWIILIE
jgi:hypothetical protein